MLLKIDDLVHVRDEIERRVMQNKRILDEFPWLWSIRSRWNLSEERMIVTNDSLGLLSFLHSVVGETVTVDFTPIHEVWIFGTEENPAVCFTEPVWRRTHDMAKLARHSSGMWALMFYSHIYGSPPKISIDWDVEGVVVVRHGTGGVTIYTLPGNVPNFNHIIQLAAMGNTR